jgi:hypothetical protein
MKSIAPLCFMRTSCDENRVSSLVGAKRACDPAPGRLAAFSHVPDRRNQPCRPSARSRNRVPFPELPETRVWSRLGEFIWGFPPPSSIVEF